MLRQTTLRRGWRWGGLLAGLCLAGVGCQAIPALPANVPMSVPRELQKVTLPPYQIEPPDVLLIEVVRWPINEKTNEILKTQAPIALLPQPISGAHLVRPDGTVALGVYGSVQVAGQTLEEARDNIKGFLGQWFGQSPEAFLVIVDVAAYNSKSYYVITDGAGYGEPSYRFPITGSETVLDALTQIQGLPAVASRRHVWVARRNPFGCANCAEQVLPVDWIAITQCGDTTTNYQVMPGDRIYVMAQPIIRVDTTIGKIVSPVERLFGVTLLGSETVNSISGRPLR
jgi:polysaccharide export outer membrane protein